MSLKSMKIEVTFRREKEEMLTSWELSNLLNNVSSNYYKNELLRLTLNEIGNGTDAKNIVILDNSFQFNKYYRDLFDIDLKDSKSLKMLYNIGKPISMLPNQNVFHIYLIFDAFALINRLFYEKRVSPKLNRDKLLKFVDTDKNINNCLENVKEHALKMVDYFEDYLKKKKKKQDTSSIRGKIGEIIEGSNKSYKKYQEDEEPRREFMEETKREGSDLRRDKYSKIAPAYFMPFFNRFTNLSRPLIGIYSKQNHKISILGINHINRTKRDEEFFDIKSISHESPVKMTLAVGLGYSNLLQHFLEEKIKRIKPDQPEYDRLRSLEAEIKKLPGNGIFTLENQLVKIRNRFIREEFEIFHKASKEKNHDAFSKYNFLFECISLAGPRDAGEGAGEPDSRPPIFRGVPSERKGGTSVRGSGTGGHELGSL